MRIVLDTNILVRANPKVSPAGLARDLLLTIVSANQHTLILSSAILVEVRRVLNYPHVQTRWPLTDEMIAQYAAFLEAAAFCVEVPEFPPAVVVKDPDDDPILQTAILGYADVLCTRDVDFAHDLGKEVCRERGIRILSDIDLIRELRRTAES